MLDRGELDKTVVRGSRLDSLSQGRDDRLRRDDDEGGMGGFMGRLFDFG